MTLTAILAAIGALGTIVTSIYGAFKWIAWKSQKTPGEKDADISAAIEKEKQEAEATGRPV